MDKGFKVVTRDSSASHEWLKMAAGGSPMQKYYQDYMHDNPGIKFNRVTLLSCLCCCLCFDLLVASTPLLDAIAITPRLAPRLDERHGSTSSGSSTI